MLNFGVKFKTFESFLLSLFLYILLIIIFIFSLDEIHTTKKYTDQKDAFVDIFMVDSIDESESENNNKQNNIAPKIEEKQVIEKKPDIVKNEIVKPTPKEEPKKIDLEDLFKDIDIKEKPQTNQQNQENSKNDEITRQVNEIVENLDKANKNLKEQKGSKRKSSLKGEYDAFKGKVQRIIYTTWNSYKANTNSKAKIKIWIDKNGKFGYQILTLDYDSDFNQKVRDCLEYFTSIKFPEPPNGKTEILELIMSDRIN